MSKDFHNPYLSARTEWLERYGSYIKARNQWRNFAFFCLAIALISVLLNVYQSQQQKIIPYVVEVDRLGRVAATEEASQITDVPPRVIQSEISRIIMDWRTVTADYGLQEKMISRLSAHIAGQAKGILSSWFESNSPYIRAKNILVEVAIKGVPLPVSDDSWRIEWTEIVRNHAGVALSETVYEATLPIKIIPPHSEDRIIKNPMGVYIVGLSWSKLLNQGVN